MKTILSIDGGGIRGIIPLAALVKLEQERGQPCREFVDMVAGTSTGSIIAAGLAQGISARGLLAMYKNLAARAFQKLPWWEILLNLGNHRYSPLFIQQTLDEIGADIPLQQLPIDILITGKNVQTSRTDFFVKDLPSGSSRWGELPLKDAVLASIAAPTYFPAHTTTLGGETHTWVDGGVGVAGNPCYHAAVEAIHYSSGKYLPGETQLLSFGTGRLPHAVDANSANFLDWGTWVFDELLEDSADWQTFITRREYGDSSRIDFRRYQLDLAPDVMDFLRVQIPAGVDLSKIRMDAVYAVDLLERIGRAFAHRIDFTDRAGLELLSGSLA